MALWSGKGALSCVQDLSVLPDDAADGCLIRSVLVSVSALHPHHLCMLHLLQTDIKQSLYMLPIKVDICLAAVVHVVVPGFTIHISCHLCYALVQHAVCLRIVAPALRLWQRTCF